MNNLRLGVTVGLLLRRPFRRWLISQMFEFSEDKGFIDSYFSIKCNEKSAELIKEVIKLNSKQE